MSTRLVKTLGLLWLCVSGPALAQVAEDSVEQADPAALFASARRAERAGQPAQEASACQALVAQAPGGRPEQACRARLLWLEARVDPDGSYAGLVALEAARRRVDPSSDTAQRLSLGAVAGSPEFSATVRAEASAALSTLLLRRGAVADALAATAPWWPGPELPQEARRAVGRTRIDALMAAGDLESARAVESHLALPGGAPVAAILQTQQRVRLGRWSGLVVLLWALVAAPLAALGWWRQAPPRPRPAGLLPLLVVGGGGWLLSVAWDSTVAWPFALLLAALALVHLLVAGAALRLSARPVLRRAVGASGAVATVAVGLLVLQRTGMLGWVGL